MATALQLLGTQTWGVQAHSDYVSGSGVKSYDIPISTYFTGDFDRLVFLIDDDALVGADSPWVNSDVVSSSRLKKVRELLCEAV